MPKQLPSSIDAEKAILGAMLIYPDALKTSREFGLISKHFFLAAHQRIFSMMEAVAFDNRSVDSTILITKLQDENLLNSIGGVDYIVDLTATATSFASLKHYVEIVIDKYKMRELIEITENINYQAFRNPGSVDSIMDEAERKILDVTRSRRSSEFRESREVVASVLENIKRKVKVVVELLVCVLVILT